MGPFEFITLLISIVYTVALTHLLFAVTRMIRHRRELKISWPHNLWMINSTLMLVANWLSIWDFRHTDRISLTEIAIILGFSFTQYLVCALVSPDFEEGDGFDMQAFHEREGRTYIGANLIIYVAAIAINIAAGFWHGLTEWSDQNATVLCSIVLILVAFFVRSRWAQLFAPLLLVPLTLAYLIIFYPALAR